MSNAVVRLVGVSQEYSDWPFVMDAILVDGRIKDMPFFGTYGKVMGENSPFVLQKNGQLDFGFEWESERYWNCNLRSKNIEIGEVFTIEASGDQFIYKISQINVLSE